MYDNQKIWQNFLYCSIDLLEINDTIVAFKRCVELGLTKGKGKDNTPIDIEILEMVVECVVGDLMDADGQGCRKHLKNLTALIQYLVSIISNSTGLFISAANFYTATGELRVGLEFLKKAWRVVLNQPGMNLEEVKFVKCVDVTLKLVDGYVKYGAKVEVNRMGCEEEVCKDWKYQGRSCLKTVMARTKDWDEHASYSLLQKALEEIDLE